MKLDLSNLEEALRSLRKAKKVAEKYITDEAKQDLYEVVRAGVIQNFEFTYELCWKFMQRWLKNNQTRYEVDLPRTRKDLFRIAAQCGLIADPVQWFDYGEARNSTAHTYDQDKAEKVYQVAVLFVADAEYFLKQLQENNE
jgi:nucleotidyltransferase substrate binding protein (TIGR01987 family)